MDELVVDNPDFRDPPDTSGAMLATCARTAPSRVQGAVT
jgi:hypothetical protein